MTQTPRVALFCETYHEINGVALTARQLVAYAKRQNLPLLAVHGGKHPGMESEGTIRRIELKRSWLSVGIESDLEFDFAFCRYARRLGQELREFRPDVIHITSPGELGELGVYLSRKLKVPLVASWHTNFHQFAARRLQKLLGFLPASVAKPTVDWSQQWGLGILLWFYGFAKVTLAPTQPQVEWLEKELGKPSFLMPRGVDPEQFNPKHRTVSDGTLRLGFVGRVTPEKGVRLFRKIEEALAASGLEDFRIVIVGDGSEVAWLKRRLKHGEFTGVLRGAELARAYANMDLFVFPSKTDTFGNVIQEAAACGVPSVVTNEGGPRYLVAQGRTGYIAEQDAEFVAKVVELAHNRERLKQLGAAARQRVEGISWDAAFEQTYKAYRHCLPQEVRAPNLAQMAKAAQVPQNS
ncbi:MAG TPA: glycosyltransferase, partial [Verrucomicrobiae bacterium]|nr:glycosyltransferase [Verrucomicrobiae bacterium]